MKQLQYQSNFSVPPTIGPDVIPYFDFTPPMLPPRRIVPYEQYSTVLEFTALSTPPGFQMLMPVLPRRSMAHMQAAFAGDFFGPIHPIFGDDDNVGINGLIFGGLVIR